MNKRQRKKAARKFRYHGMSTGKMTWGQAVQTLPRSSDQGTLVRAPNYFVQEQRAHELIQAVYPGADGIGADVVKLKAPFTLEQLREIKAELDREKEKRK